MRLESLEDQMASRRFPTACGAVALMFAGTLTQAQDSTTKPATTQSRPSTHPVDAPAKKPRGFAFAKFTPVKVPQRRSAQVGDGPGATIRVGETHRDTVLKKLGKPSYSTQNDLAFGYLFGVKTGTVKGLLFGPCSMPLFGTSEVWEMDDVWLEFNQDGILKRVEKRLIEKHKNDTEAVWREFTKNVPDKIRPEQMLGGKP
jgi:outer membrane protein assembly factor BamE (lipoprotein component of BamABCDE complex)